MAMHKATPGVHRSLRHIAQSHASPSSFPDVLDYDAHGGHPTGPGRPTGTYHDEAEAARVKATTPSRGSNGEVFKLGK